MADSLEMSARRVFVAWFVVLLIIGSVLVGILTLHGVVYVLDTIGFLAALVSFFFIQYITFRIIDALRELSKVVSE